MQLQWRPYRFPLSRALTTAQGRWEERSGWLLRLETADGAMGWGEAAPLPGGESWCAAAINELPSESDRADLEAMLLAMPAPVGFSLGLALAELDGLGAEGWHPAPPSAVLLPAGEAALEALRLALAVHQPNPLPFSAKWKVGVLDLGTEMGLLKKVLELMPEGTHLRLDANGSWDRPTAERWAERLMDEPRLQWLEQPLAPSDQDGLMALSRKLPVALDESLRDPAGVPNGWSGWRVHKPAIEGDPRQLLQRLQAGAPLEMVSTVFETGIGNRAISHLAAMAADGPNPCAAGLAPGWGAQGSLASSDPQQVWEAAEP